jgi:hypothetical protein
MNVDDLIQDLCRQPRQPTVIEMAQIRDRLSSAPFSTQTVRVPVRDRGYVYLGQRLESRASSDFLHLVRRVVIDRQWAHGTTIDEYLSDLRQLALVPSSDFVVYDRGQGPIAAVIGPNSTPPERLGPMALPYLFVVYSADRSCIITGYQISDIRELHVSDGPLWLT